MSKEKQIEEMARFMLEKSNSANVEPVFTTNEGQEIALGQDLTKLLDDVLEQAFIPFLAEALYNAGYRKQSEGEWIAVEESLPDVCGMPVLMVAENEYGQTNVVKGFTDYTCPIVFRTNEMEYYVIWHAWKVTHWMPLPEPPKGDHHEM